MGSVTRQFRIEANRVLVMERYEGDDGFIGHSRVYVDAGDRYFGITYAQLRKAGAGEIIVAEDGTSAALRVADDDR